MKTTNTKNRINLLDLVIILMIVAAVVFGIGSLTGVWNKQQKATSECVTFSVELKQQYEALLEYIEEGKTIQDGVSKQVLGSVVAIHEMPAEKIVENHDAKTIVLAKVPDKVDIVIEAESVADVTESGVKIGSFDLKVGKTIHCIVGDAVADGTVIGIDYDDSVPKKGVTSK